MEPVYSVSHANHHRFKPPVAWSGIAIDPVETIFSGLAPYLVPLFILPFHLPTVYAVNIGLVAWATWLHSSSTVKLHWLLQSPTTHNRHHAAGIRNGNYSPIFRHMDWLFGTLLDDRPAPWMADEANAASVAVTKKVM